MGRRREWKVVVEKSDELVDVEAFLDAYARVLIATAERGKATNNPSVTKDSRRGPEGG